MTTACIKPHWAVIATLSVLTIAGCRATVAGSTPNGASAAGTGAPVDSAGAGKPGAAAPTKTGSGTSAGTTATAMAGTAAPAKSGDAGGSASTSSNVSTSSAMSSSAGSDASATAGMGGSAAPMKPKNPNAIPACEGKNNEAACDGAKLYFCIDEAPDGAGMSCMSAAMCQVGLKTGKCGVCDPGKFHCEKADLQKCDDTGQWMLEKTCDSELLCKESKGICDDKVCSKDEYKCVGDELKMCNETLTDLTMVKPCDKGLCNEKAMKCNECDPMVPKACSSSSELTMCDADGKKMTMQCPASTKYCIADKKDCFECMTDSDCGMSMSECGTRACKDNKCVDGTPKTAKTKCSSGVCNFTGQCVQCVDDSDCHDAQKACLTGVACVNKVPLTAISFLGNYSVTLAAGYQAQVDGESMARKGSTTADTTFTVGPPAGSTGLSSDGCFGSLLAGDTLSLQFGVTVQTMGSNGFPGLPMYCQSTATQSMATVTVRATRM